MTSMSLMRMIEQIQQDSYPLDLMLQLELCNLDCWLNRDQ